MRSLVLAFMIGTCVSYGQRLSYGAKGGVSATEPTRAPSPFSNDESRRYVAGAAIEYRVWGGFAVESDFLYRRNGLTNTFGDGLFAYSFATGFNRVRVH